jgi:hypothetical protein
MAARGRKGADSTRKRFQRSGLEPEALGKLHNHQDAKRWLEVIGTAVVTRKLGNREAVAGIRAVEAWLKAEGERVTMDVVQELKDEVERLKNDLTSRSPINRAS